MQLKSALFAAVACSLGVAPSLHAQTSVREPTQVVVSARGVDFNNAQSVAAFDDRLRQAARAACDSDEPQNLAIRMQDNRCARESWEAAVKRVDQPTLSQRHGERMTLAQNGPGAGE